MELSRQFAEYTARVKAVPEDTPLSHPYLRDHSLHGPNPIFKAAGWGQEQPCGHVLCGQHDPEHSDRSYNAQFESKTHRVIELRPDRSHVLRPLESAIDIDTVQQYAAKDPQKARHPIAAALPGYPGLHVLDGHHRLLGAQIARRPIKVEVRKG